ncbi:restriction endonuclease subunit S, partial [Hydrogenophilus islandicus]
SDNKFLMDVLNYLDLDPYISGTTRGKLNQGIMKNITIPLPPLPEQQEIARILQTVDRKLKAEEARKQALEVMFKTLLHDLMTARRRLPKGFVTQFEKSSEVLQ